MERSAEVSACSARSSRPVRLGVRAGVVWLVLALSWLGGCGGEATQRSTPVVFVDVTVLPMTGGQARLTGQTVVVEDGRIVRVFPNGSAPLPQGAVLVQGGGRYLLPGLVDMHVRLSPRAREEPVLYIAHGVTTVRDMRGRLGVAALAGRIASGDVLGPTIYFGSPAISQSLEGSPSRGAAATRGAVAMALAAEYDGIHIDGGMSPHAFRSAVAMARAQGAQVWSAAPNGMAIESVLALDVRSLEFLSGYGFALSRLAGYWPRDYRLGRDAEAAAWTVAVFARMGALADLTARSGVWNCPALAAQTFASDRARRAEAVMRGPVERYLTSSRRGDWRRAANALAGRALRDVDGAPARAEMVRALYRAGAPLLVCSGAGEAFLLPGDSLHDELEALVAAGVSELDVLEMATRGAARFVGAGDEFGVVAPGARADLILVDRDPTEDISVLRRPDGVMVDGRWLDRAALNTVLRRAMVEN